MERAIHIHKKAFIAMVNDRRKCSVVDTKYIRMLDESQKLVLIYEDGTQEIFKGLRAA